MSLQGRLRRYYREVLHNPARVASFQKFSGGWETETYYFAECWRETCQSRVLRMYPGANGAEKAEREFRGMRQLFELGYPVSEVFAYSADPQWLGKPFITMKYITGRQSLGRHISGHYYENHVRDTITWFTRLMVELHRMDYHPFLWLVPDSSDDPAALLQRKLTDGRQLVIDQFQQMWAIPIFDWLEARLADVQKTASLSVIHNDFHIWNVMMAKGKAYVIDWSLIEVNDYRFDLGWTLLLTATNRSLEERDLILSEYDRWANHDVEHIEYFEVVAALRRLLDLAASLGSGAESSGMRPETVEIMRRQRDHYQQVYDLLRKITGLTLPEIERQISSLGT